MLVLVVLRSFLQKRKANLLLATQKKEIEESYQNVKLLGEIGQQITAKLLVEKIIVTVYKNVNAFMDASVFSIVIINVLNLKEEKKKAKHYLSHLYHLLKPIALQYNVLQNKKIL